MYNKLLLLLGAGIILTACASENGEDQTPDSPPAPTCNTTDVTYAMTVAPLLQKNCTGCHNNNAPAAGINLTTYASVKASATRGSLVGSVNHDAGYSPMPKGRAKLADCDIAQLRKWVTDGALDN